MDECLGESVLLQVPGDPSQVEEHADLDLGPLLTRTLSELSGCSKPATVDVKTNVLSLLREYDKKNEVAPGMHAGAGGSSTSSTSMGRATRASVCGTAARKRKLSRQVPSSADTSITIGSQSVVSCQSETRLDEAIVAPLQPPVSPRAVVHSSHGVREHARLGKLSSAPSLSRLFQTHAISPASTVVPPLGALTVVPVATQAMVHAASTTELDDLHGYTSAICDAAGADGRGECQKSVVHRYSSANVKRSSFLPGRSQEIEEKYGNLENDPQHLRRLLADQRFLNCCLEAGVNVYDLFGATAQAAVGLLLGPAPRISKAKFDSLLKEQARSSALAVTPAMINDPNSRSAIILAILTNYEETCRTEEIMSSSAARREERTRELCGAIASHFINVMLVQRSKSHAELDRMVRLSNQQEDALRERKLRYEGRSRHKGEMHRRWEEAQAAQVRVFQQKMQGHADVCEQIRERRRQAIRAKRESAREGTSAKIAQAEQRLEISTSRRWETIYAQKMLGAEHRKRCRAEAKRVQAERHEQLEAQAKRKEGRAEEVQARVTEEQNCFFEQKKAAEVMRHWSTLRRKAVKDAAKCNRRLDKAQGTSSLSTIIKTFTEMLSKEQGLFERVKLQEKHNVKQQEESSLKHDEPGPGQYLSLQPINAKRVRGTRLTERRLPEPHNVSNPGPGEYISTDSGVHAPGGSFGVGDRKGVIEAEADRASALPGPGAYGTATRRIPGGRFSLQGRRDPQAAQPAQEVSTAVTHSNDEGLMEIMAPFLEEFKRASRHHLNELTAGPPLGQPVLPPL